MTDFLDDETLELYIEESNEHLESIDSDLKLLEKQGGNIEEELVDKIFRAAHSIKGGSGFLDFNTIKELAQKIEMIMDLVRNNQLTPTSNLVKTLLSAFDCLGDMIAHARESNKMDISDHIIKLEQAISNTSKES